MDSGYQKWSDSLNWQLDFYLRSNRRRRRDGEFDWKWLGHNTSEWRETCFFDLARAIRNLVRGRISIHTQEWFNKNSGAIWGVRKMLQDDLSRLQFDCHLVLKIAGKNRYYFPRTDYEDFITISKSEAFAQEDLPDSYGGLPLRIFEATLTEKSTIPKFNILSTQLQIDLLNSYRQYFVRRGDFDITPTDGEVVFDCGACIGDISLILAALVGAKGEVHTFDPVPLHSRYCAFQDSLNQTFNPVLRNNTLAVGNLSGRVVGSVADAAEVSPGGISVDDFEIITLDEYVSRYNVRKVDYIKMDIEGYEVGALQGASAILSGSKPRLAISAYHRSEDLWTIPEVIKKINPEYTFYFGHHSPLPWESVYYAV